MKIVMVNNRYHLTGGPERYLFNIERLLRERGHEVIPFAVAYSQNLPTPYSRYFVSPPGEADAVYFRDIKGPLSRLRLLSRTIYSSESRRKLRRLLEDVRPDLVYVIIVANFLSPSALLACRDVGVPVVMRLSDFHLIAPCYVFFDGREACERCLKGSRWNAVRKKCMQGSYAVSLARIAGMAVHDRLGLYDVVDRFVAPSAFLRDKMIEAGTEPGRIVHVPTFVDPIPDEPGHDPGDSLLYIGRLSPEKGIGSLLAAYRAAGEPGELRIVGSMNGPEATRLRLEVESRSGGNVRFLGSVSPARLRELIRECRALVVPSVCYENLPQVALEAMAGGRAVIAHNLGSMPEAIEHERTGFLCDPSRAEDMGRRIRELMENRELARALGQAGRRRAIAMFGAARHVERLEELWSSLTPPMGAGKERRDTGTR